MEESLKAYRFWVQNICKSGSTGSFAVYWPPLIL